MISYAEMGVQVHPLDLSQPASTYSDQIIILSFFCNESSGSSHGFHVFMVLDIAQKGRYDSCCLYLGPLPF